MTNKNRLSQEALLESEQLVQRTLQAQASTPDLYESFTQNTQKQAIAERTEDKAQEDGNTSTDTQVDSSSEANLPEDTGASEATDDQESTDGELTDTIDDIEQEPIKETNEALDDWIRGKTQYSDSAIVRGIGAVSAGLAHMGIKYGPMLATAMLKGTLWTFSRIGSLTFNSIEAAGAFIEKSRNSLGNLEKRLSAAEKNLVDILNNTETVNKFEYKNQKVISYLKVGGSVDIAGNLSNFSGFMDKTTADMLNHFQTGLGVTKRIVDSGVSGKTIDIAKLMEVSPPSNGFIKGNVPGIPLRIETNVVYRTRDAWPGDALLVIELPINTPDIAVLLKGYEHSSALVVPNKEAYKSVSGIQSLSGPELVMVLKACKGLLATCKKAVGRKEEMKKLSPSFTEHAKHLFTKIADSKEKDKAIENLSTPLYMKNKLCLDVYDKATSESLVHASKVLSASIQLLEDHIRQLNK